MFAILKLEHLLARQNPSINQYIVRNAYEAEDTYSAGENDFKLAVRVENYLTGENKNSPDMVKWFARVNKKVNGTVTSS